MKKVISFLLFSFILTLACSKKGKQKSQSVNDCLKSKIESFSKVSCKTGAKIKQFTFRQKTVYVFEPGNCGADMTSEVTDLNCKNLGYLGGITGNTAINGEDFSSATLDKIIWESKANDN